MELAIPTHEDTVAPIAGRLSRAAVFTGVGRPFELQTIPVPEPKAGEILVRVLGCTVCGSDVHTCLGRRTTPLPAILGHEILGRIEAFGATAPRHDARDRPLRPGDRITWSLVASCGDCFHCRRGLPQKCLHAFKYGHQALQADGGPRGGMADYCLLAPGTTVVRPDETLSDEAACPANCGTATMVAAADAAGELRDRCVVVLGGGLLGLTGCALARSRGAAEVILTDTRACRLARGEAFGATRTVAADRLAAGVASATGGYGADVIIDTAGVPEAFEAAFPLLRLGGTFVLVGAVFPARAVDLHVERIVRRNLRLCGIHNYLPEQLVGALEFLEHSAFPWETLVSEWLPLAEAQRAFQRAQDPAVLRIGLRP